MADRHISVAGGNWSSTSAWKEAQVPTSSDRVIGDIDSGALAVDSASACLSLDLRNYTQPMTIQSSKTLDVWGNVYVGTGFGSLTNGGALIVHAGILQSGSRFSSANGSYIQFMGACQLADALSCNSIILISSGQLTTNSYSISCRSFQISDYWNAFLGSSTITLTGDDSTSNPVACIWKDIGCGTSDFSGATIRIGGSSGGSSKSLRLNSSHKEINNLSNTADNSVVYLYVDSSTGNNTVYLDKLNFQYNGTGTKPVMFGDLNGANAGTWYFKEFYAVGTANGAISVEEVFT